ncbi:MAG TPA: S53 family peptidase [Verrucomicrobiae bacterium]|jgi:subtilase family serine protease|nr:S53 family peptidase [Verrucomicrobiae bacterium]
MCRRSVLCLAVAALTSIFCVSFAFAVDAGQYSRILITSPIDNSTRVTIEGNTRPEANAKNDGGRLPESFPIEHMQLLLRRSPEQEQALRQYIDDLHNPKSANYHQWLTSEQFGEQYGLAQDDLDTISQWLESFGFRVNTVYSNRMEIDFSGSASQVRSAFQTEMHALNVKGKSYIANMSDPTIPEALARAVQGIVSLNNFKPHTMYRSRANYTFTNSNGTFQAVVPADLATIYNLTPLFSSGLTGTGQTVVVVEDTNFKAADWTSFRNKFGLSVTKYTGAKLTQVHPASSGTNNCTNPGTNGDDGEASLDAEWASAAAPNATIELISCSDTTTTFGGLIAIQNLLNASKTPPAIMSMSYGECEALSGATLIAGFNTAFQQAVTEGVSIFVSSGDDAAAGCDRDASSATHGIGVTGWGESEYNVSVGGTDFGDTYAGANSTYWNSTNTGTFGSAKSYVPEIPWNDSCASTLIANYVTGSTVTYGSSGFCNTTSGEAFLDTIGGSGGPSKCATGKPTISGVVSGTCKGYAKPSWQIALGVPKDGLRDVPDVSLFAANGLWGHYYVFCDSDVTNGGTPCTGAPDTWSGAGGTSFSSPIMAGIQALVNQKTAARQGNPNPTLYKLAAAEYGTKGSSTCNSTLGNDVASTCIFYDVTEGNMDVNCRGTHNCYLPSGTNGVLSTTDTAYAPAYKTTTGWDFATGLGTINAYNLVTQWTSVAP